MMTDELFSRSDSRLVCRYTKFNVSLRTCMLLLYTPTVVPLYQDTSINRTLLPSPNN